MRASSVSEFRIRTLYHRLDEGLFAIPRLQREFVWDRRKAVELLDSIYRRMPIGSLFVWETERRNQYLLRKQLNLLPQFDDQNPSIWFLIDGQQRLSVLHQTRVGEPRLNSDGRQVDFSRIAFRIDGESPLFNYRRAVPHEYVSLRDVLAVNWRQRFRDLPQYKLSRIEECRSRILNYRLPIIFIDTKDIDEVRDLFVRINSLGTPVGSADRAFARAANIDLRLKASETRDSLRPEFRTLRYETVLQAFALIAEPKLRDVGERAYELVIRHWEKRIEQDKAQTRVFTRLWSEFTRAFGKAVDYLADHFCVVNHDFLPSENMLATLTIFFHEHHGQPNGKQQREIRAWFWATGVAQRYSGRGHRENILKDAGFFRRLARTGRARFTLADRVDPEEVKRAEYTRRSSLTYTFFSLLATQKPCYLSNGAPIPASVFAVAANRKNRHHIFPKALLANSGFHYKKYNSLCNICFLVAEENQSWGSRQPATYLADFRDKRHFARTMKSHLVPCHGSSSLWRRGARRAFPSFVRERLSLICRAFESEAGIRLFKVEH